MVKLFAALAAGLLVLAVVLALALVFSLPVAFVAMLLLGALHSYVPQVPALGFIPVWIALFLLGLIFNRGRVQTTKS